MTDPDEGTARKKAQENGLRSGKGRHWASRFVPGSDPSDGRTNPQPTGPYGGYNNADPESQRRFFVLAAVWAVLAAGVLVGWESISSAGILALFVFVIFLWNERCIECQARRDLATDLSQNIHDGNLDSSDLRRARGYPFIEDRLERSDAFVDSEAEDE